MTVLGSNAPRLLLPRANPRGARLRVSRSLDFDLRMLYSGVKGASGKSALPEGSIEMASELVGKGIQFLVDESGQRTAVVLSLEEWGELWEDIYDVLVSESRKDEPTVDWEELKAEQTPER